MKKNIQVCKIKNYLKIDICIVTCIVTCLKKIHFLYYKNIDFLCHIHDKN